MNGNNAGKCIAINAIDIRKRIPPPSGNPFLVRLLTINHFQRNEGVI